MICRQYVPYVYVSALLSVPVPGRVYGTVSSVPYPQNSESTKTSPSWIVDRRLRDQGGGIADVPRAPRSTGAPRPIIGAGGLRVRTGGNRTLRGGGSPPGGCMLSCSRLAPLRFPEDLPPMALPLGLPLWVPPPAAAAAAAATANSSAPSSFSAGNSS